MSRFGSTIKQQSTITSGHDVLEQHGIKTKPQEIFTPVNQQYKGIVNSYNDIVDKFNGGNTHLRDISSSRTELQTNIDNMLKQEGLSADMTKNLNDLRTNLTNGTFNTRMVISQENRTPDMYISPTTGRMAKGDVGVALNTANDYVKSGDIESAKKYAEEAKSAAGNVDAARKRLDYLTGEYAQYNPYLRPSEGYKSLGEEISALRQEIANYESAMGVVDSFNDVIQQAEAQKRYEYVTAHDTEYWQRIADKYNADYDELERQYKEVTTVSMDTGYRTDETEAARLRHEMEALRPFMLAANQNVQDSRAYERQNAHAKLEEKVQHAADFDYIASTTKAKYAFVDSPETQMVVTEEERDAKKEAYDEAYQKYATLLYNGQATDEQIAAAEEAYNKAKEEYKAAKEAYKTLKDSGSAGIDWTSRNINDYYNVLKTASIVETDERGVKIDQNVSQQSADPLGLYLGMHKIDENVRSFVDFGNAGADWSLMSPEQVDTYYYYLGTDGKLAALEYLDSLHDYLRQKELENLQKKVAESNGLAQAGYSVASVGLDMAGAVTGFLDTAYNGIKSAVTGEEQYADPYSNSNMIRRYGQAMQGGVAQSIDNSSFGRQWNSTAVGKLGLTAGEFYQSMMSGVESIAGNALFGPAYEVIMGMGAATDMYNEMYLSGATLGQAAALSMGAGALEYITEHIAFEKIFRAGDSPAKIGEIILKAFGSGGLTEGFEEVASDAGNFLLNLAVMGKTNEWNAALDKYYKQGMNGNQAFVNAFTELAKEQGGGIWKSFLGGYFSGAMMGGLQGSVNYLKSSKGVTYYYSGNSGTDSLIAEANKVGNTSADVKRLIDLRANNNKVGDSLKYTVYLQNANANLKANVADYDALLDATANRLQEIGGKAYKNSEKAENVAKILLDCYGASGMAGNIGAEMSFVNDAAASRVLNELRGDDRYNHDWATEAGAGKQIIASGVSAEINTPTTAEVAPEAPALNPVIRAAVDQLNEKGSITAKNLAAIEADPEALTDLGLSPYSASSGMTKAEYRATISNAVKAKYGTETKVNAETATAAPVQTETAAEAQMADITPTAESASDAKSAAPKTDTKVGDAVVVPMSAYDKARSANAEVERRGSVRAEDFYARRLADGVTDQTTLMEEYQRNLDAKVRNQQYVRGVDEKGRYKNYNFAEYKKLLEGQTNPQTGKAFTENELRQMFDSKVSAQYGDTKALDTMIEKANKVTSAWGLTIKLGSTGAEFASRREQGKWMDGNTIVINADAMTSRRLFFTVLGHEIFHPGSEMNAELQDDLLQLAGTLKSLGRLSNKANNIIKDFPATIENYKKRYQAHEDFVALNSGRDAKQIDDEYAKTEACCDLFGEIVEDLDILNDAVDANPGFFLKLKNKVDELFKGNNTEESEFLKEAEEFRGKLNDALLKNAERTEQVIEKDRFSLASFIDEAGLVVMNDYDDQKNPLGRIQFGFVDENGNVTALDEVKAEHVKKSAMGALINYASVDVKDKKGRVVKPASISQEEANKQYKAMADILNMIAKTDCPDMVWEFVGANMFSAVRTNSDHQYSTTVDFTTVCRKTQEMITALSEAMVKLKRGLTKTEITDLQDKLNKAGLKVPCPVCYVFSRWAGIGSTLDNMWAWQNKYEEKYPKGSAALSERIAALEAEVREGIDQSKNKEAKLAALEVAAADELEVKERYYAEELTDKFLSKLKDEKKKLENKKRRTEAQNARLKELNDAIAGATLFHDGAKKQLDEALNAGMPDKELSWLKNCYLREDYKPVPPEILFDLDAGATLARDYPAAWNYRQTRGAGLGKAILPYSQMEFGDLILGTGTNGSTFEFDENGNATERRKDNNLFTESVHGDRTERSSSATGQTVASKITVNKKTHTGTFDSKQMTAFIRAIGRTRAQNLIGGQRFQSTSDYRFDYSLDYVMAFLEAQALGSNIQTYTKVLEFAKMVAELGGDVNISAMPLESGVKDGVLIYSDKTGVNVDDAYEIVKKYNSAQIILVGINDDHIRAAMNDDDADAGESYTGGSRIGFIIPYHASGASINEFINVLVANLGEERGNSEWYKNYEPLQTDHKIAPGIKDKQGNPLSVAEHAAARRDLREKILTGAADSKYTDEEKMLLGASRNFIDTNGIVDLKGRSFEDLLSVEQRALSGDKAAIEEYMSWSAHILADMYDRFNNAERGAKEYGVKLTSQQVDNRFPFEYWDKNSTRKNAYVNGFIFRSYCYSMGLIPRFTGYGASKVKGEETIANRLDYGDFSDQRGYWKTLIDRAMYNNDGTYREQNVISLSGVPNNVAMTNSATNGLSNDMLVAAEDSDGNPDRVAAATVGADWAAEHADDKFSIAEDEASIEDDQVASDEEPRFSIRMDDPPQQTKKAYKLMRLVDEKLYTVDEGVYNSGKYGSATSRDRFFMRASRDGDLPPVDNVSPAKTWGDVAGDMLATLPEAKTVNPRMLAALQREGIDVNNLDRNLFVFGESYKNKLFGHAYENEQIPTIIANSGASRIFTTDGRVLEATPEFLARVTGLSDEFKLPKGKTLGRTIVGNGIPSDLTRAVIGPIVRELYNENKDRLSRGESIRYSLDQVEDGNDFAKSDVVSALAGITADELNDLDLSLVDYSEGTKTFAERAIENQKKQVNTIHTKPRVELKDVKKRAISMDELEEMFYAMNEIDELVPLAEKVFKAAKDFGIEAGYKSLKSMRAGGVASGKQIRYDIDCYKNYDNQWRASTILHELIHGETVYVLESVAMQSDNFVKEKYVPYTMAKKNVSKAKAEELIKYWKNELYDPTYKKLPAEAKQFANAVLKMYNSVNFDTKINSESKRGYGDYGGNYGAANQLEMLSEFTNRAFRELIANKTLNDRLHKRLKELYGFEVTNMYDAMDYALDFIIRNGSEKSTSEARKTYYDWTYNPMFSLADDVTTDSESDMTIDEWIQSLIDEYGRIKQKANSIREADLPNRTGPNKRVSETVANIFSAASTPSEKLDLVKEALFTGELSYTPTSNKIQIANARKEIARLGWDKALNRFLTAAEGGRVSADMAVLGEVLLDESMNTPGSDAKDTLDLIYAVTQVGHEAGQRLQAMKVLHQLTPEGRLYAAAKSANGINLRNKQRNNGRAAKVGKGGIPVSLWMEKTGEMLADNIARTFSLDGEKAQQAQTTAQIILADLKKQAYLAEQGVEKQKRKLSNRTGMQRVQDLFDNYEKYAEAWDRAIEFLEEQYEDSDKAHEIIDNLRIHGLDYVADLTKEITDIPEVRIDEDLAEAYLSAEDDNERDRIMELIYDDLASQIKPTKMDMLNAWRYLAMLGNFRTQVRNVIGNTGFQPVRMLKDANVALAEALLSKAGVNLERTSSIRIDTETLKDEELSEIFDKEDSKVIMSGGKYMDDLYWNNKEINDRRVIFQSDNKYLAPVMKTLEKYRNLTNTAMDVGDVVFCKFTYKDSIARFMAANNTTWKNASEDLRMRARAKAIKDAAQATYRDNNAFSEAISKLRFRNPQNGVEKTINLLGEGLLPFRKTPANILVRAVEYSPLSFINTVVKGIQVARGTNVDADGNVKFNINDVVETFCKGWTGTMITVLGFALASMGVLKGKEPEDEAEKALFELEGHQDYAIEIGNKSYTLDWLAPESIALFLGANLCGAFQGKGVSLSGALDALASLSDPMLEMSMLQGINNTLSDAASNGTSNAPLFRLIANGLTSYLTQGLSPTILGQAERAFEKNRMTTYVDKNVDVPSWLQKSAGKASAKLPGIDILQSEYTDRWGRYQENSATGIGNFFYQFFSPGYHSTIKSSAMEAELERLYHETGDKSVIISAAGKYFAVNSETVNLNAGEFLTYNTVRGQTAYAMLTELTESAAYTWMSDDEKVNVIAQVYKFATDIGKHAAVPEYKTAQIDGKPIAEYLDSIGMSYSEYVLGKAAAGSVSGIKDEKGETVDNSASLYKMRALYESGFTSEQIQLLADTMNIGKTVRGYSAAMVNSKIAAMEDKYSVYN